MKRTFKYRIYANRKCLDKVSSWLELCRRLYNIALEQKILTYKQNKKSISCYAQINQLPELKKYYPEYKDVSSQLLTNTIVRLDRSYADFFKRVKVKKVKFGFPRFKGYGRYDSFTFPNKAGWKLNDNYLRIPKIGIFKLKISHPIQGDIKTLTIKRSQSDKWYACFNCDNVTAKRLPDLGTSIGLDVGIKSFCVDSNGVKVENPLYMRQAESILRRKQRKLCRRDNGSIRRNKAKLLVVKAHEKITNQRLDFLHKLSNKYVRNYGVIVIEDLKISNMVQNHHLSKSISDSSWGMFFRFLEYKAEEAGRQVIKVSPYNTSQICSQCGEKVEKSLAVRIHSCPYCGLVMNRDENAARNILQVRQTCQALTKEITLCVA